MSGSEEVRGDIEAGGHTDAIIRVLLSDKVF
jgi:hypothetical protein